ncbi:MAG: GntR family transcriptional regulator, partial [Pseudonocardiaceae bacterium]
MRPAAELDLPVVLDRDAATPLHVQLAAALRSMALSGVLPAGGRLPATRLLAARLGVARSTVLAAYEQLDGEGYLHSRHGSGTYLTAHLHPVAARQHRVAVADRCDDSANPPGMVDLRPGRPRTDRLADPAWTRAWRAAAATAPAAEAPRLGLAALRRQISAHLAVARGLVADPE